jgi:hypothetical protein
MDATMAHAAKPASATAAASSPHALRVERIFLISDLI